MLMRLFFSLRETIPGLDGARNLRWMRTSRLFALTLLALFTLWGSHPPLSPAQSQTVDEFVDRGVRAGADEGLLRTVVEKGKERGLENDRIAALLEPAVQTAEQNNPARSILMSTLEGLAKNVPTDRLGTHLETKRQSIERAGQTVSKWSEGRPSTNEGESPRARLIESVADAHQRGLSMDEIQRLREGLQGTGREVSTSLLAVALQIAPDLPESSNAGTSRRQLLAVAVKAGYDEADLRALSEIVSGPGAQNRPAAARLRGAVRSIERGASVAEVQTGMASMAPDLAPGGAGMGSGPPAGLDMSSRLPVQPPGQNQQPPRRPPNKNP